MFRSSTKNTKCFPRGGPNTPLRLTKKETRFTVMIHEQRDGAGVLVLVVCILQRLYSVGCRHSLLSGYSVLCRFYIVQLVFKSLQSF